MMTTLSQITLDFNRKIKLSNDGGELSSDSGQLLFKEFDEKIGFSKTFERHLILNDSTSRKPNPDSVWINYPVTNLKLTKAD